MSKKRKSPGMYSPSADVIGGNDYFLWKILPLLPVKSLIRSKCVSKQWRALISDPRFCLRHSCNSSSIPYGLFFYKSLSRELSFHNHFYSTDQSYNPVSLSKFDMSGMIPASPDHSIYSVSLSRFGFGGKMPSCSDPDDVSIQTTVQLLPGKNIMNMVQSCNGLSFFQFNTSNQCIKLYCVRNLATNQLMLVPLPQLDENHRMVTCSLAFDPSISPHYKIVCIKEEKQIGSRILMIYSSETCQWKGNNVPVYGCLAELANGVYCQGAIYWVGNDFSSCYCYRFDVEAEKLSRITMPTCLRGSFLHIRYFGEFNRRLHLICSPSPTAKRLNIFEFDHITMKWFVKYRVYINRLISSFPEIVVKGVFNDAHYAFSILCVVSTEKEEDSSLVMTISEKIVSYNIRSKKVEVISELPLTVNMNFECLYAYPFIPTLYPLRAQAIIQ